MAMKYTCDTCQAEVWMSGSHNQFSIFKHYPKCHKCGGKMIMPGTVRKVAKDANTSH